MPRAVITGVAGFLGSHLCDRLLAEGWDVLGVDSMITGRPENLAALASDPRFVFLNHDVSEGLPVKGAVDRVFHLASLASPPDYLTHPIETLMVGGAGTLHALDLAVANDATFLLASTSEVYGDPLVHPQPESYWGNVNPVGPRSVYDESKRYAESLATAYRRVHGIDVKLVRIFNTYGPRMRVDDGRAVPQFISQAMRGEPLTVHGDGSQTRSLCYVDDLIEGIWRLAGSDLEGPVNIGNPKEISIMELAHLVVNLVASRSEITLTNRPVDDPERRCPDIGRARTELGWEPDVALEDGLLRTIEWARARWAA
ncbi:MAG: UDP-glucuronic acid decarboxylase family protein [Actinomycetota bacterium]